MKKIFPFFALHIGSTVGIGVALITFLFTGSLLLESFFGIPGLGYKGVDALNSSDLQLLKALVILGSFLFVFINLAADVLYAWADPRVRPE